MLEKKERESRQCDVELRCRLNYAVLFMKTTHCVTMVLLSAFFLPLGPFKLDVPYDIFLRKYILGDGARDGECV